MKVRAVIFDRDGVLTYFDIERATSFFQPLLPFPFLKIMEHWQRWGERVGFPTTMQEEQAFFDGFWRTLQQEFDLDDEQYRTLAATRYTDFMQPYPEVLTVLRQLKQRDIAVGVLSNFALASLEASLEAVGLRRCVDIACAATVIGYAKPQPEAYRYVARLLKTPPQACLFLDDEEPCVVGARGVGMSAYLVDRQRTHDDRANHIVHDLTATPDLLS